MKIRQSPGIEPKAYEFSCSALSPELCSPGDSQPSHHSVCAVRIPLCTIPLGGPSLDLLPDTAEKWNCSSFFIEFKRSRPEFITATVTRMAFIGACAVPSITRTFVLPFDSTPSKPQKQTLFLQWERKSVQQKFQAEHDVVVSMHG